MRTDFLQATGVERSIRLDAWHRATARERDRQAEKRQEERSEREHDQLLDTSSALQMVAVAYASEQQLQQLSGRLEERQILIIEALIENERALKEAKEHLQEMQDNAFVLPDGRRVYETEDGTRVFDENGNELGPDVISPSELPKDSTKWEEFSAAADVQDRLQDERDDLLEYQDKLDRAQALGTSGKVTEHEYAEIEMLLEDDVPAAVRNHLPQADQLANQNFDTETPSSGANTDLRDIEQYEFIQ